MHDRRGRTQESSQSILAKMTLRDSVPALWKRSLPNSRKILDSKQCFHSGQSYHTSIPIRPPLCLLSHETHIYTRQQTDASITRVSKMFVVKKSPETNSAQVSLHDQLCQQETPGVSRVVDARDATTHQLRIPRRKLCLFP